MVKKNKGTHHRRDLRERARESSWNLRFDNDENLLEYLWHMKLLIALVVIVLAALLIPLKIPDFLNIIHSSALETIMATTAGCLSAVLGIVVAVMLIGHEIIRQKYSMWSARHFLKTPKFVELFFLYVFAIFMSVFALSLHKTFYRPYAADLPYLALGLFIVALVYLYFAIKDILSEIPVAQDEIDKLVNQIEIEKHIRPFGVRPTKASDLASADEENPVNILMSVARTAFVNNNVIVASRVAVQTAKSLVALMRRASPEERPTIVEVFLIMMRTIALASIRAKEAGVGSTAIDQMIILHANGDRLGLQIRDFESIDSILEYVLEESIKNEISTMIDSVFDGISAVIPIHLEEFPLNEDLEDQELSIERMEMIRRWSYASYNQITLVERGLKKAIQYQNVGAIESGLGAIGRTCARIRELPKLRTSQKGQVYYSIFRVAIETAITSLKKDLIQTTNWVRPFDEITLGSFYLEEPENLTVALSATAEFMIKAVSLGKLSSWTLRGYWHVLRTLIDKTSNEDDKAELIKNRALSVLEKIRKTVEAGEPPSDEDIEVYLTAAGICRTLAKMEHGSSDLKDEIDSLCAAFTKEEEFRQWKKMFTL